MHPNMAVGMQETEQAWACVGALLAPRGRALGGLLPAFGNFVQLSGGNCPTPVWWANYGILTDLGPTCS